MSEIIGENSNINVPSSWRDLYKKIVGEPIPIHLLDREMPVDETDDRIINKVTKNIQYFKSNML